MYNGNHPVESCPKGLLSDIDRAAWGHHRHEWGETRGPGDGGPWSAPVRGHGSLNTDFKQPLSF